MRKLTSSEHRDLVRHVGGSLRAAYSGSNVKVVELDEEGILFSVHVPWAEAEDILARLHDAERKA